MPTDIVNSVTIKLEPGLDQIIDTEAYNSTNTLNNINNNQDDQVPSMKSSLYNNCCHFQSVIKEEFSYYSPSGPKYEKFSKHLTVKEMVRLHFDPYISSFDLSKQPILVLDKVDYENQNFQTDSCFSFGWGSLLVYLV